MAPLVDPCASACYNGAVPVDVSDKIFRTACSILRPVSPEPAAPGCAPRVSVIVPARNEVSTIAHVIRRVHSILPQADILVIDNASTDGTAVRAHQAGARIVYEPRVGKGAAMRAGVLHATGEVLVFLDGDDTYPVEAIPRLLDAIQAGRCDVAVGSRFLGGSAQLAWPRYWGNRALTAFAQCLYGPATDVMSGLYALPNAVWQRLNPQSTGFDIETELFIQARRAGLRRQEIPIAYRDRSAGSKVRLLRDGLRCLWLLAARRWSPLSIGEWLRFYRLRGWRAKVANARLLFYGVLGYAVAGHWDPIVILFNTVALLGLVMFQGALNDYWDFHLSGERNFLGSQIQAGRLTDRQAVRWLCAPLALSAPMILLARPLGVSWPVPSLLLLGALLAVCYSVPPIRLKIHRPWGLFVAPTLTTLMFFEAHLALGPCTLFSKGLLGLLFLFQLYAELLQVVADSPRSAEKCSPGRALALARWLPGVSACVALGLAWLHPAFWMSVIGSLSRLGAVWKLSLPQAVAQHRARTWGPLLSPYEFLGYGLMGTTRLLG